MDLERANGVFHPIAAMHIWRDKLEGGVPLEGDCFFISKAGFVIQDLEINGEPTGRQMSHDDVVGCNAVAVTLGLEGLLEDEVAVGVECNHDILVTRASSDGEEASVVSEELAERFFLTKTRLKGVAMGGGRTASGANKVGLGFVDQTF